LASPFANPRPRIFFSDPFQEALDIFFAYVAGGKVRGHPSGPRSDRNSCGAQRATHETRHLKPDWNFGRSNSTDRMLLCRLVAKGLEVRIAVERLFLRWLEVLEILNGLRPVHRGFGEC
jgi:hypothetical protein